MSFTYDYPRPMVTVDATVFRRNANNLEVLLIRRGRYPFAGMWALPGGFIEIDETLEDAIVRELEEETGLKGIKLEQLHAFSDINRDPRGRTISVTFYGMAENIDSKVKGGDDAEEAQWHPVNSLPELAFDHDKSITMALKKLKI